MNRGLALDQHSQHSILQWAAQRQTALTVSVLAEGRWFNLRSQLLQLDQNLLQIVYPMGGGEEPAAEIGVGDKLGISFRRGHKKCIFVSPVVMRRAEPGAEGGPVDTLFVSMPDQIRELQRRAYQRVTVPTEHFIAVKVWQGGIPSTNQPSWPLCAGRIGNISVGGVLVDIRADQNPRLSVGDIVGLEITVVPGRNPLLVEAQYRHCAVTSVDRIGLGLQLLALEHNLPGRATITEVADFVKGLMRGTTRRERAAGQAGDGD
jgi:c-di-GMP-binding flagellar brake protein YcgR